MSPALAKDPGLHKMLPRYFCFLQILGLAVCQAQEVQEEDLGLCDKEVRGLEVSLLQVSLNLSRSLLQLPAEAPSAMVHQSPSLTHDSLVEAALFPGSDHARGMWRGSLELLERAKAAAVSALSAPQGAVPMPLRFLLLVSFVVLTTVLLTALLRTAAKDPSRPQPGNAKQQWQAGLDAQLKDAVEAALGSPPPFLYASRVALSLPSAEPKFRIAVDALRVLRTGATPVPVLGPSGRPLLLIGLPLRQGAQPAAKHHLAGSPAGRRAASPIESPPEKPGMPFLEILSATGFGWPHAILGPMELGALSDFSAVPLPEPVPPTVLYDLQGASLGVYGRMMKRGNSFYFLHLPKTSGRAKLALSVNFANPFPELLSAFSADGHVVATVIKQSVQGTPMLAISTRAGADPLLCLLAFVGVLLMTDQMALLGH